MIQPAINAAEHLQLAKTVAFSMARKESHVTPVEDTEAYADAVVGLVKAANKFDVSRGLQFSTLAWRACLNQMISSIRVRTRWRESQRWGVRETRLTELQASFVEQPEQTSNVELIDAVRQAVAELPHELRLIIQMRMENITQREIGEALGRSTQRVQQLEVKAHRILAARLRPLVEHD